MYMKNAHSRNLNIVDTHETSPVTIDILVENAKWQTVFPDYEQLVNQVCLAALQATGFLDAGVECELSVVLADDKFIQVLNKQYRGKDAPTNVLSFPGEALEAGNYAPLAGQKDPVILGDIVLSLDTLTIEAVLQGKTLYGHCCHLLVHGVLHLLGYDHETDSEAILMEHKEIDILYQFGIKSPYEE
jgi:probable rRNA maturation factor